MTKICPYNRGKAVAYALEWAMSRNPAYLDFEELGGDCTNFASQCLLAGGGVMNITAVFGWYYITSWERTASWTGARFLQTMAKYFTGTCGGILRRDVTDALRRRSRSADRNPQPL